MHRPTGIYNPDAPLGHHIGQDVGHISSTLLGVSLQLGETRIEASTFHGAEPEPESVDLPLGRPDSLAVRLIQEFSPSLIAMVSAAYVNQPEPEDPSLPFVTRYSASVYNQYRLPNDWLFFNSLIYGLITRYDGATSLNSLGEEFLIKGVYPRIWGRFEFLQRTPLELQIPVTGDQNQGLWITAFTLGYSHKIASIDGAELNLGVSATKDFLPQEFKNAYGGDPWSGKVFLRVGGMKMWEGT